MCGGTAGPHRDSDELFQRLDVYDASCEDGANIQIYQDNGSDAQRFRLTLQPDGTYLISNVLSGKALDVAGGSRVSNANVRQYGLSGQAAQKWYLTKTGDGYYIRPYVNTGLCLDVGGAGTANGTNVKTYMIHNSNAQKWRLIYYPGPELTAVRSTEGDRVTVSASTGSSSMGEARLIAAWYDGDGVLLGSVSEIISLPDGETAVTELFRPSYITGEVSCRVFMVGTDDFAPLCPAVYAE